MTHPLISSYFGKSIDESRPLCHNGFTKEAGEFDPSNMWKWKSDKIQDIKQSFFDMGLRAQNAKGAGALNHNQHQTIFGVSFLCLNFAKKKTNVSFIDVFKMKMLEKTIIINACSEKTWIIYVQYM